MVRSNNIYLIKYFIFYVFQTFAAIGDFGSVVEQLLMTHGKKITGKIYSIMWKCKSIWPIHCTCTNFEDWWLEYLHVDALKWEWSKR